jgi:uncharacterized protein (DUF169 family)
MTDWKEITQELDRMLKLKTLPIAYKNLKDASELDKITNVKRLKRFFMFCQLQALVRYRNLTVGVTINEVMNERCSRIHGLLPATETSMAEESVMLSRSWFATPEEARKQLAITPRIPVGSAIVMAPLAEGKFDPDVVLIYGNPAQLMMLMCGLQKIEFERFQFFFIGEGACSDSLAQCYNTGKPSLAIPCFGERRFGEVMDDELVIALPPALITKAIEGMKKLAAVGLKLPIPFLGAETDPLPSSNALYPGMTEYYAPKLAKLKKR